MTIKDWIKLFSQDEYTNKRKEDYKIFQDWCQDNNPDYLMIAKMLNNNILDILYQTYDQFIESRLLRTANLFPNSQPLLPDDRLGHDKLFVFAFPKGFYLNSLIEIKAYEFIINNKLTDMKKGCVYYKERNNVSGTNYRDKYLIATDELEDLFYILLEAVKLYDFLHLK